MRAGIRCARIKAADLILRILAGSALAVDAALHSQLAPGYQSAAPGGFGEGNLFLAEAAAAGSGLCVLICGSRRAWILFLLTACCGLAVVLLYPYVDVPAFGLFPAMCEPVWFFEKIFTALAKVARSSLTQILRAQSDLLRGVDACLARLSENAEFQARRLAPDSHGPDPGLRHPGASVKIGACPPTTARQRRTRLPK